MYEFVRFSSLSEYIETSQYVELNCGRTLDIRCKYDELYVVTCKKRYLHSQNFIEKSYSSSFRKLLLSKDEML